MKPRSTMLLRSRRLRSAWRLFSLFALFALIGQPSLVRPSAAAPGRSAAAAPLSFARSEFEALWSRTDAPVASGAVARSWLWGPAPGETRSEPYAQGVDGRRTVQYFDKARMELNTAVTDPASPWRVTTGLLVTELVTGKVQTGDRQQISLPPSTLAVAGDSNVSGNPTYASFLPLIAVKSVDRTGASVSEALDATARVVPATPSDVKYASFIKETSHNIPDVLLAYMNQTGTIKSADGKLIVGQVFDWVYTLGYPISEPYWVSLKIAGTTHRTLVQLFQRRVLTYVPDFPAGWQVQMGNVGQHYYSWRYGSPAPVMQTTPGPSPTATPVSSAMLPATGGFVGISGDDFVYAGSPVKLKGTNYWLHAQPFVSTWAEWDGPVALAELQKARDLGVNTIRIGLPFNHSATRDVMWNDDTSMSKISPWIVNQMTQLLQVASVYGMKVIFVLFEWYDEYPVEGSRQERTNIAYLEGLVGAFANDDRVLAWDLHNEPDAYGEWQGGHEDRVIDWLQRMSGYVRHLDKRHAITVGVADAASLWHPASDGTTILSFVDFAAFHSYNAGTISTQINEIRRHTAKPILLEEMGWPSAPGDEAPPDNAVFDESTQNYLYKTMLDAARSQDIAGVAQWVLWDYTPRSTTGGRSASYEEHFGLVRLDGSYKPAADTFRTYQAPILPSDTKTYEQLTPAGKRNVKP